MYTAVYGFCTLNDVLLQFVHVVVFDAVVAITLDIIIPTINKPNTCNLSLIFFKWIHSLLVYSILPV